MRCGASLFAKRCQGERDVQRILVCQACMVKVSVRHGTYLFVTCAWSRCAWGVTHPCLSGVRGQGEREVQRNNVCEVFRIFFGPIGVFEVCQVCMW